MFNLAFIPLTLHRESVVSGVRVTHHEKPPLYLLAVTEMPKYATVTKMAVEPFLCTRNISSKSLQSVFL